MTDKNKIELFFKLPENSKIEKYESELNDLKEILSIITIRKMFLLENM